MTDCPACGISRVVTVGNRTHCLHCGRVEHVDEKTGAEAQQEEAGQLALAVD